LVHLSGDLIKAAKEKGEVHKAEELENGDTLRQLLARSRYLLCTPVHKEVQNPFIMVLNRVCHCCECIVSIFFNLISKTEIHSGNY